MSFYDPTVNMDILVLFFGVGNYFSLKNKLID